MIIKHTLMCSNSQNPRPSGSLVEQVMIFDFPLFVGLTRRQKVRADSRLNSCAVYVAVSACTHVYVVFSVN